jgi:hypothetical protein
LIAWDTRLTPQDKNSFLESKTDWLDIPVNSLKLNYCWVCQKKFTAFGGEPNFFCHEHHLVPRAYGGIEGPTYSLCSPHHTALHQIALRLDRHKSYSDLLSGNNKLDKKLLWLASIVVNAKKLTTNDPNKPVVLTFVARGLSKKRLKELKKVYKLSYNNIMEMAIKTLHSKHFQN